MVGKAVQRAAWRLGITAQELRKILGKGGPDTGSGAGEADLYLSAAKELERALVLLRIWRALEALVGGDVACMRLWLRNPNDALGGLPVDRLLEEDGPGIVAEYLEARANLP